MLSERTLEILCKPEPCGHRASVALPGHHVTRVQPVNRGHMGLVAHDPRQTGLVAHAPREVPTENGSLPDRPTSNESPNRLASPARCLVTEATFTL